MNLLEPKRSNPVVFRLGRTHSYALVGEEYNPEPIILDAKQAIGGNCYGMTIYTEDGLREYFKTQLRIVSAEVKAGYLIVYEAGKSIPWRISQKGKVTRHAHFDAKNDDDVEFVREHYNLTRKAIPALNEYEAYVENVMQVEPKVSSPILIDLRDPKYSKDCYLDEKGKLKIPIEYLSATIVVGSELEKVPLSKGIVIDEEKPKYGFKVIGARKSETFPTQCPLFGVQVVDSLITIYEYGKTIPWKIDVNGDVLEYAQFLDASRRDVRYLSENLCLSKDDIENVNSYGLKYVNKEN